MSGDPAVSVIIPTYQRRLPLQRALGALARQTAPPGSYEVIVSVDGSTDGTLEMIASFDAPYALRAVSGPARGRAAARNVGLAAAQGGVVVGLDDDMQPAPRFIESHHRHHPPGSRTCVLGAVPVHVDGSSPRAASYVQAKFDAHLARLARPDHVYGPRDFYSGNMSLRTEVLREVGGFDETFTPYGNEDVDLSLRLRAAGVDLRYEPEALAHQEYDKEMIELASDTFDSGGTTVIVARKHPHVFGALQLAIPDDNSRPWRVTRSLLLRLTRGRPGASRAVLRLVAWLERAGLWRQPLFYRAALDYAFWAGVDAELLDTDDGELAWLAAELRRGPLDLLLRG